MGLTPGLWTRGWITPLGQRSYGIYLWHWPVFMVTRPGFELGVDGWPAHLLRVGLTLGIAELSYRFVETPIRRGAIGRLAGRARARTPDGRRAAVRLVAGVLALALVAWAIGMAMVRAAPPAAPSAAPTTVAAGVADGASRTASTAGADVSAGDEARTEGTVVRPAPATEPAAPAKADAAAEPTAEPTPEPQAEAAAGPARVGARQLSAFGDSVLFGARDFLRERGAAVTADEALSYRDVFDAVRAAQADGSLRRTAVLHTGNNGAIAEGDLRGLLDQLRDRDVVLVTLDVPRAWERYYNDLFTRVASDYPNVRVLNWRSVAEANPAWLYDDRIHLVAPEGRQAYTDWLLDALNRTAGQ